MVETPLTCVAMYGGRTPKVLAWLSLRENQAQEGERERESHPTMAHGGHWRQLKFGCVKLGHHSICSVVSLISSSLSPFLSDEHVGLWFIDILLV